MKEEQFRRKISWFALFFSLLVIWVHSYNTELYLRETPEMEAVYRLEVLLGDRIGQIAVPGFFMISGYLFYRDFTWRKLGEKWRRRIRSVLMPYVLWNFLYYIGYVVASRLPWVSDVVGKGVIPFTFSAAMDAVIHYTYNYVFWYLFQLILLILLAPLLYPVLKNPWSGGIFMAILWWVAAAQISLPLVNADALIYYSSAACLALADQRKTKDDQKDVAPNQGGRRILFAIRSHPLPPGACLLALSPLLYYVGLRLAFVPCFVLCRLAAVTGLWLVVPAKCLPPEREFMKGNFFLYGIHFALVRFINKAGAKALPSSPVTPLLLYLAMPFMILFIAAFLGKFLRRHVPVAWNLLSGGR